MKMTQLVFGTIILSSTLLAGCSNHAEIERLSSDVQMLNSKVDQLSGEMSTVRSEVQDLKRDTAHQKQRLNNKVHSYRK
ncbi:Lpp/OprI family alanine-zipper lipoprotein [Candidatus Regiella insecticola]|uniref:Murein-lipoprotein n=1 Tax=Candidatus Regiella insecticola TaxID=138073 RepID=A0A6L2ZQN2_9ENTR|nr:Lpp/OprI family alanine-zipper lipoprotein [Candidatus Regiella insecticola]GFN46531.1 murein-lipoprotein [Candidatus Regiella insecticola]